MTASPAVGARALILSGGACKGDGGGRYSDEWHDFGQTSAALAELLRAMGLEVEVDENVDERLAALGEVDLLVFNLGRPEQFHSPAGRHAEIEATAGLAAYRERGGPLLAVHAALQSMAFMTEWEDILGGIWVPEVSMHPPLETAAVRVYPNRHPIVAGLTDFEVDDERYSLLRMGARTIPLAAHTLDDTPHPLLPAHPLVWAHERGGRVVVDALGHDTRSYQSPEHRELLRRAVRWLLGEL